MVHHIEGESRDQRQLVAPSLDELLSSDHPVRVIDAFVELLDLKQLGFSKVVACPTGRPPFRPADMLKLYIYGYCNQMRSSRRLEKEARRNLEVQWLIDRLQPSFKTIASFRKDHAAQIVKVARAFIIFCRDQSLLGGELVAIDGTKIEAVASRRKLITPKRLARQLAAVDARIADYLAQMDVADREEGDTDGAGPGDVQAALAALEQQRGQIMAQAEALADAKPAQKVIGEEEARLMKGAHGYSIAYNAQSAVDDSNGLIVAFDLTNECSDIRLLAPMAEAAKAVLNVEKLTVIADAGYSNGEHARTCSKADIIAVVPRPDTPNPKNDGFFTRDAFRYDEASDSWTCPAKETLAYYKRSNSTQSRYYKTAACGSCALKPQCTRAPQRSIARHDDEAYRDAMHQRARGDPGFMKRRRELVEHPFGILKWMLGRPRFLLRGLEKAKAELALVVIGFNMKRAINIKGVPQLLADLRS